MGVMGPTEPTLNINILGIYVDDLTISMLVV
jgi:hypothetical protein